MRVHTFTSRSASPGGKHGPHSTEHSRPSPDVWDVHTATSIRTTKGSPGLDVQMPFHSTAVWQGTRPGRLRVLNAIDRTAALSRLKGPSRTAARACRCRTCARKREQCQPGTTHRVGCQAGKLGALGEGSRPLPKVECCPGTEGRLRTAFRLSVEY
eukprot:366554-Chlamydomonas_euryale.AAC.7